MERLSMKLKATLKRIRDNLIIDSEQLNFIEEGSAPPQGLEDKVAEPHLSPIVNLAGKRHTSPVIDVEVNFRGCFTLDTSPKSRPLQDITNMNISLLLVRY